ncbi:MAG: TadE/TadG family type IV pilus assembly protein [Hyphomonadaceae bacterium]
MPFALSLVRDFRAQRRRPDTESGGAGRRGGEQGAAAVEFALIAPVLLLLLLGVICYGGYFFTAHTVQQIANDAARAAVAGLDDAERRAIARDTALSDLQAQSSLRAGGADVAYTRSGGRMSVRVSYDASRDVYWAFAALVPLPSPRIERTASVQVGGF